MWLLSMDSTWLPRGWIAWDLDLTHHDIWDPVLAKEIYGRDRRAMRWTRSLRQRLDDVVGWSLARLGVEDSASEVAQRFIDHDFIGARDEMIRRRRR
jgi:hypothetical protein